MITLQRSRSQIEPAPAATTFAVERIELGRRVCDAIESENMAARVADDSRLSAILAVYAAVCRRADYARRRAAVAQFARQLRQPAPRRSRRVPGRVSGSPPSAPSRPEPNRLPRGPTGGLPPSGPHGGHPDASRTPVEGRQAHES
jgi:hypothetical protein